MTVKNLRAPFALIFVLVALLCFWLFFVVVNPVSIWGLAEDAPIMSLAQAINIDYWFFSFPRPARPISQAQFYQPGIPFQVLSWVNYRLTANNITAPFLELFRAIEANPKPFWQLNQACALILTFLGLFVIWLRARSLGILSLIAALLIYFTAKPTLHYGVFVLWNESFTLLFSILFFTFALFLLEKNHKIQLKEVLLCGFFAGFLYMHKMNYVVWGFAFVPALVVHNRLHKRSLTSLVSQVGIFVGGIALGILIIGRLILRKTGFAEMLSAHHNILTHSGIYGNGDNVVLSGSTLIKDLNLFMSIDPFVCLLIVFFTTFPLYVIWQNRGNLDWLKAYFSQGVMLVVAMLLMTLALIKHFQPHYTVSVAAIFPLLVIWCSKSNGLMWKSALLLFIGIGILYNGINKISHWKSGVVASEIKTAEDEAEILKMPMTLGQKRFWMYRVIAPSFQRLFSANFAGLEAQLQPELNALQGDQYMISPYHQLVMIDGKFEKIREVNWRYIVMTAKPTESEAALGSEYRWLEDPKIKKINFQELTVYENTEFSSKTE